MDTLHAPGARTSFGHGAGGQVWLGRRRRREREEKGDAFSSEGDAFSALMIKFRSFVATTSSPGAPQLRNSRVCAGIYNCQSAPQFLTRSSFQNCSAKQTHELPRSLLEGSLLRSCSAHVMPCGVLLVPLGTHG